MQNMQRDAKTIRFVSINSKSLINNRMISNTCWDFPLTNRDKNLIFKWRRRHTVSISSQLNRIEPSETEHLDRYFNVIFSKNFPIFLSLILSFLSDSENKREMSSNKSKRINRQTKKRKKKKEKANSFTIVIKKKKLAFLVFSRREN